MYAQTHKSTPEGWRRDHATRIWQAVVWLDTLGELSDNVQRLALSLSSAHVEATTDQSPDLYVAMFFSKDSQAKTQVIVCTILFIHI